MTHATMASFGKVLDLLDDRYLELQDVVGNVEPLPKLVPYEAYSHTALVYRLDAPHDIFLGLIQDLTMRRAHELHKELWSWLIQWEIDDSELTQQPSLAKKLRPDTQNENALSKTKSAPRKALPLTIFERRTLDGALMLEEDMLRILIDIVQIESSLVPNFIEFLYQFIDYYEGDGNALKAALRREIPSLWDFEYHPLLIPRDEARESTAREKRNTKDHGRHETTSTSRRNTAGLRQKPDLAAFERRTLNAVESERLQYREVRFGIQPPKLEQPLPPLINVPVDYHKRIKYYAACFKSRQRALHLLLEAGISTRHISNYQRLQTTHPKDTSEAADGNGLRNYEKDAKFAQDHFELTKKSMKHSEIAISNKLAVEAQLAATHAIPDGASSLPLIPPTPMHARRPDLAADVLQRLEAAIRRNGPRISDVPRPLLNRMNSEVFGLAKESREDRWQFITRLEKQDRGNQNSSLAETNAEEDGSYDSGSDDGAATPAPAPTLALPQALPRSLPLPLPLPRPPNQNNSNGTSSESTPRIEPDDMARYIQSVHAAHEQTLEYLFSPRVRQNFPNGSVQSSQGQSPAASGVESSSGSSLGPPDYGGYTSGLSRVAPPAMLQGSGGAVFGQGSQIAGPNSLSADPSVSRECLTPNMSAGSSSNNSSPYAAFSSRTADTPTFFQNPTSAPNAEYFVYLRRQQEALQRGDTSNTYTEPNFPSSSSLSSVSQPYTTAAADVYYQSPVPYAQPYGNASQHTLNETYMQPFQQAQSIRPPTLDQGQWQFPIPTRSPPDPPTLQSTLNPQAPQFFPNMVSNSGVTNQYPLGYSTTPPTNPPTTNTMLPPPLPGITRNAPAPLSLSSPKKASPYTTLAPEVLATSPFACPSLATKTPIQIYLPKILHPPSNLVPSPISADDARLLGHEPTDAILLGHEDKQTGALTLSKAILLPVGIWENILRKVRAGKWEVLESYMCPREHPALDRKGKGKCQEGAVGCHRAVYDKLEQAYGMMQERADVREELLTKRWRVAPGPMTSFDRGAVWEGWGVYVDKGVEMSAVERVGAWRMGVSAVSEERRREIEELIREDEESEE